MMNGTTATAKPHTRFVGFYWVAGSVCLVAIAQLLLKVGVGAFSLTEFLQALHAADGILPIGVGLACYVVSMFCWLRALEYLPLAITYPLLSLSYPLVYVGAMCLPALHEAPSLSRSVGVALIMLGVVLLAPEGKSSARDHH